MGISVNSENHQGDLVITEVDKPLRYSLIIGGQLSGPGTLIKSTKVRFALTILNIVIILFELITWFTSLVTIWDKEQDSSLYVLFFKACNILWFAAGTFGSCILFVLSQRNAGLAEYYARLQKVGKTLTILGVHIRYKRLRKFIALFTAMAWLFFLVMVIRKGIDFATTRENDPAFGINLRDRIDSYDTYIIIQTYGYLGAMFPVISYTFLITYFLSCCFVLITLLADFNRKFKEDIAESPSAVLENLESYRTAHLELCELVAEANSNFSLVLGFYICISVLVLLLVLYIASVAIVDPNSSSLLGVFIYWITVNGSALCILTCFPHRVQAESVAASDDLLKVYNSESSITTRQVYQMQLFLTRMSKPEAFTSLGLMDVNKDFGITVEEEVRVQVDELMREELKNLQMAVERDKKGKKGKKSGKKKKKKKKSGKKKGKKGKKEKDLTPDRPSIRITMEDDFWYYSDDSSSSDDSDFYEREQELFHDLSMRSIESLYEELVEQGIIKKVKDVSIREYEGEYSYLGTTLRQANIEPMPSLSDVRRVVTEFGILPLGSPAVHERAPLVKSMMLAGPRGTGKKMLVHAVCNETGANLFDLTAANIAGRYPGKEGLKMLIHMVFKVGRALQPSVYHMDNCELMFKKKIPKTDPTDPKRLKKELPKAIKAYFKPEDRILLVGTSRSPFDGEMKPMCQAYQKIILIPRPDYASRHLLWRSLIIKHHGILNNNLDVSSLAKVTDGYTPGHIDEVCVSVLKERRIADLAKKPLQGIEFLSPLAKIDPIYKEEEEAYKSWYSKTPLGKKRSKAAAGDEDDGGGGKKGGKGGKKGGKKKK